MKTLIIPVAVVFVLSLSLYACSDDADNSTDGDEDSEMVETENDSDTSTDGDTDGEVAETENDADAAQPVPHGREVLPERIPGECPRVPPAQTLPVDIPEGMDCYQEPGEDTCSNHSDCAAGDYGFCLGEADAFACRCFYHQCLTDDECVTGQACLCFTNDFYYTTAECLESCLSSGECADKGKCVQAGAGVYCGEIYFGGMVEIGVRGYRCTSAADECASDYDCPEDEYCVLDEGKGHFACVFLKAEGDACE